MNNVIKIITDNIVESNGREFTKVVGGFGENKPVITVKQIAELMNYDVKVINQTINRNIEEFVKEEGYLLDLKEVTECDYNLEVLKSLGYTNMGISKAKNLYILSESGFLLYLKFADGQKAIDLYKDFIEDYFKTKAENIDLKLTLQEEIDKKYELHDFLFGKAIRTRDRDLLMECDKLNEDIIQLEKKLTEELTVAKYKKHITGYESLMDSDGAFTFENCSKIISTNATGDGLTIKVNKISLPKLLREKGILSKGKHGKSYNNTPNSGYEEYFTVSAITYKGKDGELKSKSNTKINPKGLDYIYNLLKEEGI